ncbi:mitochondrial resolvase Ydc2 [Peziza echinospora]|nr:mitochondrial resolvase Ydc2 [Peziza echinospora]
MPPPLLTPLLLTSSLKLAQLRQVATALGLGVSSPKALLADDICSTLLNTSRFPYPANGALKPTRILSIDMGIRNLAICVLEIPPTPDLGDDTRIKPEIIAWQRIAISPSAILAIQEPIVSASRSKAPPIPTISIPGMDPHATESYTPESLSNVAYMLCKHLLQTHKPDQILIERQRYRSMGSAMVQEWTIRVNMFETIIWGCLHALYRESHWPTVTPSDYKWKPIHSMDAKKVLGFWEQWHDTGTPAVPGAYSTSPRLMKPSDAVKTYEDCKASKTFIVTDFLYSPPDNDTNAIPENQKPTPSLFEIGSAEAQAAAKLFLPCFVFPKQKKNKSKKEALPQNVLPADADLEGYEAGEENNEFDVYKTISPPLKRKAAKGKLDDLADCLLQGLAWVKWEEARRRILGNALGLGTSGASLEPRATEGLPNVMTTLPEDRLYLGIDEDEEEDQALYENVTQAKKRSTTTKKRAPRKRRSKKDEIMIEGEILEENPVESTASTSNEIQPAQSPHKG